MAGSAWQEGENAALALRQRLGLGDDAVDLEDAASRRGALVFRRDFRADGPDGMYAYDGDQAIIVVNAAKAVQRQRFTLAHELGHHELHRVRGPIQVLDVDVFQARDRDGAKDPDEVAANAFAAHLLLPRTGIERVLADRRGKAVTAEDVVELVRRFRVSWQTACYRLHNESYIGATARDRLLDMPRSSTLAARGIDDRHFALTGPRIPAELSSRAAELWRTWHITDERLAELLDVNVHDALRLMQRWDVHREDPGARAAEAGERALTEAGIDVAAIAASVTALDEDEEWD